MQKKHPAPTHAWLIGNRILRFFGWCFLLLLAAIIVCVGWLRVNLHEHCTETFERAYSGSQYWLKFEAGAVPAECSGNDN